MTRAGCALLALLVTAGAAPRRPLPVPPLPPANPPADQSAPLPDRDFQAPREPDPQGPQVGLRDFRIRRFDDSPGYVPGSHFETGEDKRSIQTPGLTVRVPLR
jgi:hypothetical protein